MKKLALICFDPAGNGRPMEFFTTTGGCRDPARVEAGVK
jgi:hypothetical protein